MAAWFNRGMFNILNGDTVLSSATINVLLMQDSWTFTADENFVDDAAGADDVVDHEVSGGSYARQTLGSKTINEDDAGGRAWFDAADSTFSAVPTQTPDLIDAAIVFDNAGGADTARDLLFYNDWTGIQGNGSDIQVQWHASGIAEIT